MSRNISTLLLLTILLLAQVQTSSADWQASGNMSQSNLTELWRIIDATIDDGLDYDGIACNISA